MSVLEQVPGAVHARTVRFAGAALAVVAAVAWTAAVLLTPAMITAGLAADAATTVDYDFAQGTERFFLAEAYDLRFAALVAAGVGVSLAVATLPVPRRQARTALAGCAAALLAAHVVALLLPAATAPAVALAAAAVVTLVLVRSARAAPPTPPRTPGALPALLAAGLGLGLTILTTSSESTLDPWVLPETVRLHAAILTLLVVAAITAACATGTRWFRGRAAVGAAVAVGAAALLFAGPGAEVSFALVNLGLDPDVPSGLAGPLYAVVGATALGLVFAGRPAGRGVRVRQGLGALVAGCTALVAVPVLSLPGLFTVYGVSLFYGAAFDAVPSLVGTGVVYGLVLMGAYAIGRR